MFSFLLSVEAFEICILSPRWGKNHCQDRQQQALGALHSTAQAGKQDALALTLASPTLSAQQQSRLPQQQETEEKNISLEGIWLLFSGLT